MSIPDHLWKSRFPVPAEIAAYGADEEQEEAEQRARSFGLWAHMARLLATQQQIHRKCPRKSCRRARACIGQRLPVDWDRLRQSVIPPCLPAGPDHPYAQTLWQAIDALRQRVARRGLRAVMRRERRARRAARDKPRGRA